MSCPKQRDWVEEAAEYARFEGRRPERYGYTRGTDGGWVWEDKSTEEEKDGSTKPN